MKKLGRNDPCHCGSGKKFKQCCLTKASASGATDRTEAVPKTLRWLETKHKKAVVETLREDFFGMLEDDEYAELCHRHNTTFDGIMINAMEWLIAEGSIFVKGQEKRVSDLLLGRDGPLFSTEQREWITLLATQPLVLYEVIEVTPGESLRLRDVLFPDREPVLVHERAGSRQVVKFDLIAGRVMPLENRRLFSGALYLFPRFKGMELIKELKLELAEVAPDSQEAREIMGVIIPQFWLTLFIASPELPTLIDQSTGEPLLLITDHYRVQDWEALSQALSQEADVEGDREDGWSRIFEGQDGQTRRSVAINIGQQPNRIELFYRTQKYADAGRLWFEKVAGQAATFLTREIADPKGIMGKQPPDARKGSSIPVPSLSPEEMRSLLEQQFLKVYAGWADQPIPALDNKTPREAIKTAEGLEQVKFLLHSYEHNEAQQAQNQQRPSVSFEFLWQALGIQR